MSVSPQTRWWSPKKHRRNPHLIRGTETHWGKFVSVFSGGREGWGGTPQRSRPTGRNCRHSIKFELRPGVAVCGRGGGKVTSPLSSSFKKPLQRPAAEKLRCQLLVSPGQSKPRQSSRQIIYHNRPGVPRFFSPLVFFLSLSLSWLRLFYRLN